MPTWPPSEHEAEAHRRERQEKTVLVNLLLFPPRHINPAKRSSVTKRLLAKGLVDEQGLTQEGRWGAEEHLAERMRAIGYDAYLRGVLDLCEEHERELERKQGKLR